MKISSLFSALLFLFAITASLAAEVHLGTKNPYPIGNNDVSSKIFLFFLQQQSIQEYADDAFMTSPDNWLGNANASIKYTGDAPSFTYSMIPGHEEDIIDAVNSASIQHQFNNWYADWTKNPTRQEFCDYFRAKSLAYFWSHDGRKIIPTPTIYFDDQTKNVTQKHNFFFPDNTPDPNQDHAVTGADAISKCYEDFAEKIAAPYVNGTCWQSARHECPIFMNGRVRLLQVKKFPSVTTFDFLNILLEERFSSCLQVTRGDVTQQQDGFDFSSFNSSKPIPEAFGVVASYDNAFLGIFKEPPSNTVFSNDKFTALTTHDQFSLYFILNIKPIFIASPIIKFDTFVETFSQSSWGCAPPLNIKGIPMLLDPTTARMRDTGWDLFGVMYDAL